MNSYILKSLREEKGNLYRPAIRRSGKKKSCFIDHNDYVVESNSSNRPCNVSVKDKKCSQNKNNEG